MQTGLVVSSSLLGALAGSLIALSAGNKLGRRTELMAAAVLYGAPHAHVLNFMHARQPCSMAILCSSQQTVVDSQRPIFPFRRGCDGDGRRQQPRLAAGLQVRGGRPPFTRHPLTRCLHWQLRRQPPAIYCAPAACLGGRQLFSHAVVVLTRLWHTADAAHAASNQTHTGLHTAWACSWPEGSSGYAPVPQIVRTTHNKRHTQFK